MRFYVPPAAVDGGRVRFDQSQRHQLRDVLRVRPGTRVAAFDGSGVELELRLDDASLASAVITGRRCPTVEPVVCVTLYQSLLRAPAFDLVLQKATELGVARIVPAIARRCVARAALGERKRRWLEVVREAAEQSGRVRLPEVSPVVGLREAFSDATASEAWPALLWEEPGGRPLGRAWRAARRGEASLFIGPEGGFEEAEAREAEQAGLAITTLGTRVLRAETAAIVACALLLEEP